MGFEAIEISNGSTDMSEEEKLEFIKIAKNKMPSKYFSLLLLDIRPIIVNSLTVFNCFDSMSP